MLDYIDRWEELEKSDNPFAVIVMAHLKTQDTRHDDQERKIWKFYLVRRLYECGYQREDVINLLHFIDWLMRLPEDIEESFWAEMRQYEEGKKMEYVSSVKESESKKEFSRGFFKMPEKMLSKFLRSVLKWSLDRLLKPSMG